MGAAIEPTNESSFDGAAVWDQLSADEQVEIGRLAIELVVIWLAEDVRDCDGAAGVSWLPYSAEARASVWLDSAVHHVLDKLRVFEQYTQFPRPSILDEPLRVCRVCGRDEDDMYLDLIWWADKSLCTICAPESEVV